MQQCSSGPLPKRFHSPASLHLVTLRIHLHPFPPEANIWPCVFLPFSPSFEGFINTFPQTTSP